MPQLRLEAYRVARRVLTINAKPLEDLLSLLFQYITQPPSTFNPIHLPNDSPLTPLIEFQILAEISEGLVVTHREHSINRQWVIKSGRARALCTAFPYEEQVCALNTRNIYKVPLSALGHSDIKEIGRCFELSSSALFIGFENWYWDGNELCFILKEIYKQTLADFTKNSPANARRHARDIATQILNGLAVMDTMGIHDCDLNPENIYVSPTLPIKIKLSNLRLHELPFQTPSSKTTPTSPESSGPHAQHMWSLGCIIYTLLSSETPFDRHDRPYHRIWNEDRERFVHYREYSNKHPSKEKLESCASTCAARLVKNLLTVGHMSITQALGEDWIAKILNGQTPLPVDVRYSKLEHCNDERWVEGCLLDDTLCDPQSPPPGRYSNVVKCLIKRISLNTYYDREEKYEKEIKMLLRKKSLAQFLGWFQRGGNVYFLMEYSEYGCLDRYLMRNGGNQDSTTRPEHIEGVRMAVCEITSQIMEGLADWNELGYSDLRPTNILISSIFPMRVKLLINSTWDLQHTATHIYMAPELLGIQSAKIVSDISSAEGTSMWSLGCLVYKIVTGENISAEGTSNSQYGEIVSTEHIKMLKDYCNGSAKLAIDRLGSYSGQREWLLFVQGALKPSPNSRLTAKSTLGTPLFEASRTAGPCRWGYIRRNNLHVYLRGKEKTEWHMIEKLEGGAMGVLSVMESSTSGGADHMVVKELTKPKAEEESSTRRRELITLIKLKDYTDLYVKFLGWYEDFFTIYIVMEYLEHGDLDRYLVQGSEVATHNGEEITMQLLEALEFLHEKELCHRDLKPQNVLVSCKSPIRVKLADFGVSKSTVGTRLRTNVGTLNYQAPELLGFIKRGAEPQELTYAVDMWSMGCLVHKILAQETPFVTAEDDSATDISGCVSDGGFERFVDYKVLSEYCGGKIPLPKGLLEASNASDDATDFIERLLVPDPAKRMTASEALKHRWLNNPGVHNPTLNERKDPEIIKWQLCSLGVNISQRTADKLVERVNSHLIVKSKTYLPTNMLRGIDTLRERAKERNYKLLHSILCRIHTTIDRDTSSGIEWTVLPS